MKTQLDSGLIGVRSSVQTAVDCGMGFSVQIYDNRQEGIFERMGFHPDSKCINLGPLMGKSKLIAFGPDSEMVISEHFLEFYQIKDVPESLVKIPWSYVARVSMTTEPSFVWPEEESVETDDAVGDNVVSLCAVRAGRQG